MKFKIVPVNERNARLFNGLPKFIYKNDPNWVPHLKTDIDYVFKENKNKYFTHGSCKRWILEDETKQVIGRIAAFINEKKAYSFAQPTGGIGFFECIDNVEASTELFDTAKEWLESKGMEAADGPR